MKRDMDPLPYELVDQAWDSYRKDKADGVRLARLALEAKPTEIDAFVILALCSPSAAERIALLREGMRLGEIEHAVALAEPDDHTFWSDIDSRPYMRSVHNLILDLWKSGDDVNRREAVRLGEHLIRINPGDNQGIRFLMMNWLPVLDRWEAVARLLREIGDDHRTETSYTRALVAYRIQDDDADDLLARAIELNPYVPAMIKGRKSAAPLVHSVAYRSREEAESYAHHAHAIWASVRGARQWIARRPS